jgi:hypothetical protein
MANYIARVELHAANYDDYEELHDKMRQQGFSRQIHGSDGKDYHLPTGTYVIRNANVSTSDALNRAGNAAEQTGKKSSIIVADWDSASWRGLSTN